MKKELEIFCDEYRSSEEVMSDFVGSSAQRDYQGILAGFDIITYRCLVNLDWTMLFLNDSIEKITGYKVKDFINDKELTYASIICEEDRGRVAQVVAKALVSKKMFNMEYNICTKGGVKIKVFEKGRVISTSGNENEILEGIIIPID